MSQLEAATSSLRRFAVLLTAITLACIGLGIGIGLGLSVSGVLATHDDPAIIHACVDRVSRLARIVEDPNDCTRYERLVEWQSGGWSGRSRGAGQRPGGGDHHPAGTDRYLGEQSRHAPGPGARLPADGE